MAFYVSKSKTNVLFSFRNDGFCLILHILVYPTRGTVSMTWALVLNTARVLYTYLVFLNSIRLNHLVIFALFCLVIPYLTPRQP